MAREPRLDQRELRLLHVTPAGSALLDTVVPAMLQAQKRILAPLAPAQRPLFLAMLKQVVDANNGLSRAPSDG